jgi:tryptophan-rich sensory protein
MKNWKRGALNVAAPVALALATNGLIFTLGWNAPDHDRQPWFAPPGYVVGMVWTVLFGCMGAARWRAVEAGDRRDRILIDVLIVLCLAYPFYTAGLQDRMAGLAGIVVTGLLALVIVLHAWRPARGAALLLLPLLGWLWFAGILILSINRLNA